MSRADPAPSVTILATSALIGIAEPGKPVRAYLCRHGVALNCPICGSANA